MQECSSCLQLYNIVNSNAHLLQCLKKLKNKQIVKIIKTRKSIFLF
jgi:hypothetical protein